MRLYGFPPIIAQGAGLLILGSFPSVASLEGGMYYGHSRNQFWPTLARIYKTAVPVHIDEKLALLRAEKLALWDLVGSCEREGSLDQHIQEPVLNDIAGLVDSHPGIERILLNGSLAAELFYRSIMAHQGPIPSIGSVRTWKRPEGRALSVYRLPSTSPVPTKRFKGLEDKLPFWEKALKT
jgi:hypoxanthine-DNA glycosylase